MDIEKNIQELRDRLTYIKDIFGSRENENIQLLTSKLDEFRQRASWLETREQVRLLNDLTGLFDFLETKLERQLTPMDKVRIVRHPYRICLKDILEHVYDNYTEMGGQEDLNIDPSMLIARAYIARRVGNKVYNQPVMVIGQEKGHGQEFRNGGSVKPWGNAKALKYMLVAETENIPIHTYVFTPGSYPIEDYPGAAQQIAQNLYEMAKLRVPVVAVISEGGSGGAEAIGLADRRLMLSHGYYSVISPEGAAAIEARVHAGHKPPVDLVEQCARKLKITAEDNFSAGYVDAVVQEPALGARTHHYEFFKQLRREVVRTTDEVFLDLKRFRTFRTWAHRRKTEQESIFVRWSLSNRAREKLVERRYEKFRSMSKPAYYDGRSRLKKFYSLVHETGWAGYSYVRHRILGSHRKKLERLAEEIEAEARVLGSRISRPLKRVKRKFGGKQSASTNGKSLTELSYWESSSDNGENYISPRAKKDVAVTCPNSETHGCLDIWAPDLYGEFAGVCPYCGHHFPMEYEWFLYNVFDPGSIYMFNQELESTNPLGYEGLDLKLEQAKKNTGQKSACLTFEAKVQGLRLVVAMLTGSFRGGTVGAAEGEKLIRAAERAKKKHYPFLAYSHGTAGIRIQEGTNGVIQMPRCTMAVRNYLEAGGLYLVLYDTNSYAGPVASFLGCSPYQFALRSSNIGFAGPGVIRETTGLDVPPDYHNAYKALSRGHIQGIWDRRELRKNIYQVLITMGGRNIYYR